MPFYALIFLRVLSFVIGFSIVFYVLISVIRTFVLPRSAPDKLVRLVFIAMRKIFDLRISIEQEYERRDEIMALYAPFTLIILPAVWLVCVLSGYMAMFWPQLVNRFMRCIRLVVPHCSRWVMPLPMTL